MEIPDNLCSFDFALAWESFKEHFDAVNERYWLHHFSKIGVEAAVKEIEKEISKP